MHTYPTQAGNFLLNGYSNIMAKGLSLSCSPGNGQFPDNSQRVRLLSTPRRYMQQLVKRLGDNDCLVSGPPPL